MGKKYLIKLLDVASSIIHLLNGKTVIYFFFSKINVTPPCVTSLKLFVIYYLFVLDCLGISNHVNEILNSCTNFSIIQKVCALIHIALLFLNILLIVYFNLLNELLVINIIKNYLNYTILNARDYYS